MLNTTMSRKEGWMSSVNNNFVRLKEILIFIVFAIVILILLFPKGKYKKILIISNGLNTQSVEINEYLFKKYSNLDSRLLLVQFYISLGKFDEAYTQLQYLNKDADENILRMVKYLILKARYFSTQNTLKRREYSNEMESLLTLLLSSNSLEILEWVYSESINLAYHKLAFTASKKISALKNNQNIKWLRAVYKHALELADYTTALEYLAYLSRIDSQNKILWMEEYYKIAAAIGKYELAINTLLKICDLGIFSNERCHKELLWLILKSQKEPEILLGNYKSKYLDVIINAYMINKQYNRVVETYLSIKDPTQKNAIFKKIVTHFLSLNNYTELKNFLQEYYKDYINDLSLAKFILKAALATGDMELSYKIAKDIRRQIK